MSEEINVQIYVQGEELANYVTRLQQRRCRCNQQTQMRGPHAAAEQRIFEKWYSRASLGSKVKFWKGLR